MKTPDTATDDQKLLRRQLFLKKILDERMASEAKPRTGQNQTSQSSRRGEEARRDDLRSAMAEKRRAPKQSEVAQLGRHYELRTGAQRKREEEQQAEIQAARLREERRNAQRSEAAQHRGDEELQRKQEAEQQAEERVTKLREQRRNEELKRKQEAERQAEARTSKLREQKRTAPPSEAAASLRDAELRRKQETEQQAEIRTAQVREDQRNALQADAARAQREEDLMAATLREREAERQAEARAAKLQEEQRSARQNGEKTLRDEELQAAALRNQKHEQRLAGREQAAAEEVAAGKYRQEQQNEEAFRLQAEARRAAAQSPPVRKQESETTARTKQSRAARSRTRLALKALAHPLRVALKSADTATPPAPSTVFYLSSSKSLLVDENNETVNLRGITVRGLDTVAPAPGQTFPAAIALDDSSLLELSTRWGANLVRLPFQAQTILSGNGTLASGVVLEGLDATVAAITEAGDYVLLAMEPPPGGGTPAPDSSTTQAWQTLAARYQTEPRVLFELFASPLPLAANWLQSAASLVATVRQQNPSSVIFLGSGRGGVDVTGLPLVSSSGNPLPNIVYTIAVTSTSSPSPDNGPFRALADSYPVFASMWSDDGKDVGRFASREADFFERFGIGWAAANWNTDPRLVADAAHDDFTPTGWGLIAQRALAVSVNAFQPASALSHSIFATKGPALHHLKTLGSFIVDENDNPVNLRGVTVQGLDTVAPATGQSFPAALALDDQNLLEICDRWGANLVRLPFQASTILSGNAALPVAAMLAGLDATVAAITESGAYVLLALQAPAGGGPMVVPYPPATQVWQALAERYQKNSGVLFEIFFSPNAFVGNWLQAAAALVTTIRQRKPTALIFLGSGNGGSNVSGLPLLTPTGDPAFNLVYTITVSAENMPNSGDGKLSVLAESNPVFASSWSEDGSDFGRISARVPDLFDRYGMGCAASNWNADPRLVVDAAGHDFTSTGWGLIVGRAFRLPGKALLKPYGAPTLEDL